MNEKRKQYGLWVAIALLFCLNVATIGWIVRKTRPVPLASRVNAEAFLPKRLGFDKQQRIQYRQYRQALRKAARPQEDSLRQARATLFRRLQAPELPSDAEIDSLASRVGNHTKQLTQLRFRHWKRVRELCTPEQKPAFDQLMTRLLDQVNRTGQNTARRRPEKNNR